MLDKLVEQSKKLEEELGRARTDIQTLSNLIREDVQATRECTAALKDLTAAMKAQGK